MSVVPAVMPLPDASTPPLTAAQVKDHLSLIAEMTLVFSESHSFATVAKSALERIAKHVGAEASSLFMLDDHGNALVCTACYGPVDITGMRLPILRETRAPTVRVKIGPPDELAAHRSLVASALGRAVSRWVAEPVE